MKQINKMRASLLTLLVVLLAGLSAEAQLNGVYTVYGSGANFPDLQAAANALSAGVSGPVVFKIRPGTHTSSSTSDATIGNIAGANATNTITFEAENGDASTTIIRNTNTSSSSSNNMIFYLNNAKYVRVRDLTLQRSHSTYACAVRFAGSAQYNIIEDCIIEGGGTSTSSSNHRIYGTSMTNAHHNIIRDNSIDQGYYGIYWRGNSTSSLSEDNEFIGNTLTNIYRYGMYIYYTSNHKANGNTITSKTGGSFYGFYLRYCDDAFEFDNNKISKTGVTSSSYYPIYAYYMDGTALNRGSFSGNEINVTSSTTSYGIRIYNSAGYYSINNNKVTLSGSGTKYPLYNYSSSTSYGNSVYVEGNEFTATTSSTIGLYSHNTYCSDVKFNNNIVDFNGGSGSQNIYAGMNYVSDGLQFKGNKITMDGTSGSKQIYTGYYYTEGLMEVTDNDIEINSTSGYCRLWLTYYSYYNDYPGKYNNNKIDISTTSGYVYSYMGYYNYNQSIPGNECRNNEVKLKSNSSQCYNYFMYYFDGGIMEDNNVDVYSGSSAAYGIYTYGHSAGTTPYIIRNNQVKARAGSSTCYGFVIYYPYNAEIYNNAVSARGSSTTYGLMASYLNGGGSIYNNTVNTNSTGTQYTFYSYQSSGSQFATIRNNMISRSGSTSGYLCYFYNPSYYDMDYNNLYNNGATMLRFASGGANYSTIPALRAGTGQNMNSLSYAPAYMNASAGDLRPDPTAANSWSMNGRGEQIAGNDKDVLGSPRAEKTINGVPDLGAYEFTPTSTPPNCTLTPAAPAPSSTQVVTFGDDTVAVLRWNAAVPTSGFNVKQYTGTTPPGITSINPTRMYYYVDFQGTGSSLDYEQDLYYKEPWLGTIASKSALRLAEKVGSNNWTGYAPANSSSNIVRNFIETPSVNDVGALFTGIDVSNNAGVETIIEPTPPFCPGTYTVKLLIKNNGNNVLNNVKIAWEENGTPRGTINHTTPININGSSSGNEAIITLGSVTFGSSAVNIKAWTFEPNGVTDPVPIDDTLDEDYFAALGGTYTIGGTNPDFPDVVTAANALNAYGTCGDVIFDIRPGTYTGQVLLSNAANVGGGTAHVTFRSENMDRNSVTIAYNTPVNSTSGIGTILLKNGASKFRFEHLTISGLNPSYAFAVEYEANTKNDTFDNCDLVVGPGTSSYLRGVSVSSTAQGGHENMAFTNLDIQGASYAMYIYTGGAGYSMRTTIENCTMTARNYGIYGYYNYEISFKNNTITASTPSSSYAGMYVYQYPYFTYGPSEVSGNRITGFYGYSLYAYYMQGGSSTNRNKVMNNSVITSSATSATTPILFNYPEHSDLINNTFVNNGTSTSTYGGYLYLSSYKDNKIMNNVFAHLNGGYVFYIYYLSGYDNVFDYNNLYTTSTSQFTRNNPAVTSFAAWRSTSKQDAHSVTYDPAITSATDPAPDVTNPAVWALNGHAVQMAGNTEDINGDNRVDSRVNGVPDIGAYEVDPEVAPPAATANPAVADQGDTQIFTFAGNEVGRIKWGYTMPVAPVTVQQYSGEKGQGVAAAASPKGSMYFHTDVTPSGTASAFDFDLNVDYMDIWLGDIGTESDLRLAHKVSGYPWMVYSGSLSTVDAATNNLDGTGLNRFDAFTGLENNSVASAFVRSQGNVVICIGNSVVLNAEPNNGDNYKWYRNGVAIPGADGPNAKSITASQAGDYSVAITFSGKVVESVPVTVSTIAAPNAIVKANSTLTYCPGNGLTLNAGNATGVTYQWQLNGNDIPGANGRTYGVQQSGDYTLVATNIGCSTVSTVTPVTAGPLVVDLGNDTTYCEEKNVWTTLDAGYPGAKYLWSTGDTSRTIEVKQGGNIWVEVDAGPGCVDRDDIIVTIDPLPSSSGISFVQNGNDYTFFPSGPQNVTGGYLWLFSDGTRSTQQNPSKTISGDLYVRLVMFNACGSDTTQLGWPLSVSEVAGEGTVSLYPNPAKDRVTLTAEGVTLKTVEILNSVGSVVYRAESAGSESHSADISGYANGHYMMRATTSAGIVTRQFDIVK